MHARTKAVGQAVLRVVGAMIAAPFVVVARLDTPLESAELFFAFGSHSLAGLPGFVGNAARAAYYRRTLTAFEAGASVHFGSYFSKRGAAVRAGAGIGAYCVIGLVTIGPRARIASRVSITSGIHYHGSAAQRQDTDQIERVWIGADSWIGEGALVGADVGAGAIVGMGAVVLEPVPDGVTVIGNPARRLPTPRATVGLRD
ncbi:MAG: acyltransferase [Acidiferrobacter sp.]